MMQKTKEIQEIIVLFLYVLIITVILSTTIKYIILRLLINMAIDVNASKRNAQKK